MALFKSMAKTADTAGTIFPGTIVPIRLELHGFQPIALPYPGRGSLAL
jgi:hypothetical protein